MNYLAFLVLSILILSPAAADTYSIGVLAYNGKPQAIHRWQLTADYLSNKIPHADFRIVPLTLEEGINAINKQEIDFILTNPGHYVRLEVKYGVTRIVTFLNRHQNQTLKYFSAVIFTRQDSPIKNLSELKGKSFAAVSEDAFGGFQLARLALFNKGINALQELDMKWMGFPHSDIVKAVIEGRADAGIVRSGVIEKMALNKELDLSDVKVLEQQQSDNYPFLHSVGLYPEWPLAKLPHTDTDLSKQVTIRLLQMSAKHPAAQRAGGSGWTIPLTYSSIHEVLRTLQVEPYPPKQASISTIWMAYRHWIILLSVLLVFSFFVLFRLSRTNVLLKNTQQQLQKQQLNLEQVVQERTDELLQLNETLQIQIASHVQSEKTLQDGCESLKSLYSVLTREDLDRKQKLNSFVDSLRHYLAAEFGALTEITEHENRVEYLTPTQPNISIPLSPELSQRALKQQQIVIRENIEHWRSYVACPILIQGAPHYLLEFASSQQFAEDHELEPGLNASDLRMNILSLVSQWIGNEARILKQDEFSEAQLLKIQQRFEDLSPREKQVLALLVQGESSKSMARKLSISAKTIEMHRANLLRKTQAKSSTELVQLAVISGLFDLT